MASLLYPDDEPTWPSGGLLTPPDDRPPVLQPDPRAAALGQTYQTISDYMAKQQAKSEAEGYWTGGGLLEGGRPTGKGLLDAIRQTGTAVALGTSAPGDAPPPGFTAYHGSPHSFEAFDASKIGTGEGAQAYGHGMYTADNEAVARGYRDKLSGGSSPIPGASDYVPGFTVNGVLPPTGMAGHAAMDTAIDMHGLFNYMDMYANKPSMSMFWKQGDPIHPDFDARPSYVQSINYLKGQIENRIARFQDRLGGQEPNGIADRDMTAISDYYNTHVKDATPYDVQKRPPGHMYEVQVNADPAHFLDWDRPLSEQSQHVREALTGLGVGPKYASVTERQLRPVEDQIEAALKGTPLENAGRTIAVDASHSVGKWDLSAIRGSLDPGAAAKFDAALNNLTELTSPNKPGAWANLTGKDAHDLVVDLQTPGVGEGFQQALGKSTARHIAASEALRDAGIPGIRYLDQQSRGAGEGTRNTVVFSPEIMEIIRRYGIGGLIAGGGAAGLGGQQGQQQ